MKRLLTRTIMLFGATTLLTAQDTAPGAVQEGTILIERKMVEKADSFLVVDMTVNISGIEVDRNRSVVCTPLIHHGDSLRPLPPIVINGRDRHILYERQERKAEPGLSFVVRRQNKKEQRIDYHAHFPFSKWMEKSELSLVTDLCGCGWEALQNDSSVLFSINMADPILLVPQLAYAVPQPEPVKQRALEGRAFLDFPVNKTEIYPEYRNNPQELCRIRESIESVRNDAYATITDIDIKGYASPEGSYANNAYLAEYRAKALMGYVNELYDFGCASMQVNFEPEDWKGLEEYVENSDLPEKEELLAIIRADEPADWDQREWRLKTLAGGVPYQTLLREVYPALRHSDYVVKYTIRNFTVEEAKELLYTDPSRLSVEEMFRVAQTYEPGGDRFKEVFEIAVRMYPDDPVSNLNAANIAISEGKVEQAKRYLAKAETSPEKQLAEAGIAMLEGDLDRAETLLLPLKDNLGLAEDVANNLEQIAMKRAE